MRVISDGTLYIMGMHRLYLWILKAGLLTMRQHKALRKFHVLLILRCSYEFEFLVGISREASIYMLFEEVL